LKIKYFIINKFFHLIGYLPGYFRKKIFKIKDICFVPTNYYFLPKNNHPILTNFEQQKKIIKKFKETEEEITFKTYPKLVTLLKKNFSKDESFNFLDFGGDQIDQYLILKKKFKNIKYFIINQKQINNDFLKIKEMYGYKDLNVINDINKIDINYYDFVNFGSVLQYIDDYEVLLDKILPKVKKYVLVSGTHFYNTGSERKFYIVKQVNLLPRKLYLYFFKLDIFLDKFKKYDLKVIHSEKNQTHDINYENFTVINMVDLKYSDIFFKK